MSAEKVLIKYLLDNYDDYYDDYNYYTTTTICWTTMNTWAWSDVQSTTLTSASTSATALD